MPTNPQPIRSAEILAIGTELLLGQTVNSNAAYLARFLSELGLASYRQQVVGDNAERIQAAMRLALDDTDLLLCCGGLGPTEDDISMASAAALLDLPLRAHPLCEARIRERFAKADRAIPKNNWKQALIPEGARVLDNPHGTACGVLLSFLWNGKARSMALLPGPPHELEAMCEKVLKPLLAERSTTAFTHAYLNVRGIGESALEERLGAVIQEQDNPTMAMYASHGSIRIRVTERHDKSLRPQALEAFLPVLRAKLAGLQVEEGEASTAERLGALLLKEHCSLAIAESCTAGLSAALMGAIPGISAVFRGGVVSYARQLKQKLLQVPERSLEQEGEVSEAVALAMARGMQETSQARLALGITGIAGPGGGSPKKPVGMVCFGLVFDGHGQSCTRYFRGNRAQVQARAAEEALALALAFLREHLSF